MRWRISQLWALASVLALSVFLAFAYHPEFSADSGTGMSAPSAPRTSIDSTPVAKLLQSHSNWRGQLVPAASHSLTLAPFGADGLTHPSPASVPHYGPLHR